MSAIQHIFMHMFGRPRGVLARLGGIIMARTNAGCGAWLTDLLEVGPKDSVLEVGFGLWLRTPRPIEQRNIVSRGFSRGFERVYGGMENAYTRLIGRMVRVGGLMVLIGLALAILGIWGIARLPTAFIPNEDQGYLMIVAQLPDGAALGRTTAALDQATRLAQETPGWIG